MVLVFCFQGTSSSGGTAPSFGMPVCSTAQYSALCTGCHVPMCANTASTWYQSAGGLHHQLSAPPPSLVPTPQHPITHPGTHPANSANLHHPGVHPNQGLPHPIAAPPAPGFVNVPPPVVIHRTVSIRIILYFL